MKSICCCLGALAPNEREREQMLLSEHLNTILEVRESAVGFSFRFAPDPVRFVRMAEFICLEHRGCSFLDFSLEWHGGDATPWLHISGVGGAKSFIADTFIRRECHEH